MKQQRRKKLPTNLSSHTRLCWLNSVKFIWTGEGNAEVRKCRKKCALADNILLIFQLLTENFKQPIVDENLLKNFCRFSLHTPVVHFVSILKCVWCTVYAHHHYHYSRSICVVYQPSKSLASDISLMNGSEICLKKYYVSASVEGRKKNESQFF